MRAESEQVREADMLRKPVHSIVFASSETAPHRAGNHRAVSSSPVSQRSSVIAFMEFSSKPPQEQHCQGWKNDGQNQR